jgi:hypothetical protein
VSNDDGRRPSCPARQGKGTDISAADFTLVVHDCETGPDGQPTATEVFGLSGCPASICERTALPPMASWVGRCVAARRLTATAPRERVRVILRAWRHFRVLIDHDDQRGHAGCGFPEPRAFRGRQCCPAVWFGDGVAE